MSKPRLYSATVRINVATSKGVVDKELRMEKDEEVLEFATRVDQTLQGVLWDALEVSWSTNEK